MTTNINIKENIQSEKYTFVIKKIIASSIGSKTKVSTTYLKSFFLKRSFQILNYKNILLKSF